MNLFLLNLHFRSSVVVDHEFLITKYLTGKILDFAQIKNYNFIEIFEQLLNENTAKKYKRLAEEYFSLDEGVESFKKSYAKAFK